MSAQSGITASSELLETFKDFDGNALVVKVSADSSTLVPDQSFPSGSGDLLSTFELLHSHLHRLFPDPAYVLIPLPAQTGTYMFISFISDEAPIRQKMLYASTKNQLITALGLGKFPKSHNFSWSELKEVSYDHYMYELESNSSALEAGPLSTNVLEAIDSLQSLSVASSQGPQKLASMHACGPSSKLLFTIDGPLEEAIASLACNASDNTLILCNVDTKTETLRLTVSEKNVKSGSLIDTLESHTSLCATPYYALFNYAPRMIAFVYACPSGSKVKDRMVCAASKTSFITYLKDTFRAKDLDIAVSLEVGDFSELDVSQVDAALATTKADHNPGTLKLSKPRGPRRR